jgi:hypothetical protein
VRRQRTADDWKATVYGTRMKLSTKVYLIWLADHMTPTDRKVKEPRDKVARALGISTRAVDNANTDARTTGFLSVVVAGRKGVTAIYQGTFPDLQREQRLRAEDALAAARDTFRLVAQREDSPRAENDPTLRSETPETSVQREDRVRTYVSGHPTFTACEPCSGNGCPLCCGEAVGQ